MGPACIDIMAWPSMPILAITESALTVELLENILRGLGGKRVGSGNICCWWSGRRPHDGIHGVSRGQYGDGIGIRGKKEQGKQTAIGTERPRKDT
jgi:hypothetical protein